MANELHVCPVMFSRMQEHAQKADFYGIDPAVAALAPTGINAHDLRCETKVICDLDTPIDSPDGVFRLDRAALAPPPQI